MDLSIIVPVYNVAPYLHRCIDSILVQSFDDMEIILVDDGSTDGSSVICDDYAQKDYRIHVLHQNNMGVSAARNAGISLSVGKYLCFIDSDDYIHPQMLQLMHKVATTTKADIVQCDIQRTENLCDHVQYTDDALSDIELTDAPNLSSMFYPHLWGNVTGYMCTKLIRKEVFSSIRFPLGRRYEDIAILPAILSECSRIAFLHLPLYFYYIRPDSFECSSLSTSKICDHLTAYIQHFEFYQSANNETQMLRAQGAWLTMYLQYYLRVYLLYPELKKEFRIITKQNMARLPRVLHNSQICNLQKFIFLSSYVCPLIVWRMCQKYYPECIPHELRKKEHQK